MSKCGVVFVHGFRGGEDSWQNSSKQMFYDMLKADKNLSKEYDFFCFDYFSKLLGIYKSAPVQRILGCLPLIGRFGFTPLVKKNQTIKKIADSLDGYLRTHLSEYDEVIIIAHSMGGLIAKSYILDYEDNIGPKPIGFVSIAVPHKGVIGAVLLSPSMNVNAKELLPLSEYGDHINNEWVEKKDTLPDTLYITALHDEFVKSESSIPYKIKKASHLTVDHDHLSVCKPENVKDITYIQVSKFLTSIAYQKKMLNISKFTAPVANNSDYDKEIFVIKLILEGIHPKGIEDAKESFFSAEIVSKAANKKDQDLLIGLQQRVLSLYRQSYAGVAHKSSIDIFKDVHTNLLQEDEKVLHIGLRYINFLHKKGLLQQLANKLDTTVVWSDSTTVEDIKGKL